MLTLVYFVYFLVLEEAVLEVVFESVKMSKHRNMPNCTEGLNAIIINRA